MEEGALESLFCIWRCTLCVKMVDAYVFEFTVFATLAKSFDEYLWSTRYTAEVDVVTAFDNLDGLFS